MVSLQTFLATKQIFSFLKNTQKKKRKLKKKESGEFISLIKRLEFHVKNKKKTQKCAFGMKRKKNKFPQLKTGQEKADLWTHLDYLLMSFIANFLTSSVIVWSNEREVILELGT